MLATCSILIHRQPSVDSEQPKYLTEGLYLRKVQRKIERSVRQMSIGCEGSPLQYSRFLPISNKPYNMRIS